MSGGFFRGTSAEQDTRFSNKMAKLLKTQKFAPELDQLVDIGKVQMDVIKPWIATRVTELLGFEDEVLINFIYGLLDGKDVDGKGIQIQLTGFMEKNTGRFMKELWGLLTSAQSNQSGIPQQFLDAKAEETKKKKEEEQRILSEVRKREEQDKESDLERQGKNATTETVPKLELVASPPQDGEKKTSETPNEPQSGARNGSPVIRRARSRSNSRTPPRRRHSVSPHRRARSPRAVRSPPRRRRSPVYSRSPPRRRKSPPSRSQQFRRSPIRARRRSPLPSRSPPRRRLGRSRSPRRRRSPSASPSPSPLRVHKSLSRSPPRAARKSPIRSPARPRARGRRSPSRSPPRLRTRRRSPSRSPPLPLRARRRSPSRSPVPLPARARRRSPSRSPPPPLPPQAAAYARRRSPSRSPPLAQPHRPRRRSPSTSPLPRARRSLSREPVRPNGGLDVRREQARERSERTERRDAHEQRPADKREQERVRVLEKPDQERGSKVYPEQPEQEQAGARVTLDKPVEAGNAPKGTQERPNQERNSRAHTEKPEHEQGTLSRGPVGRVDQDRSGLRRSDQDRSSSRKQLDPETIKRSRSVSPSRGDGTDGRGQHIRKSNDVHPPSTPNHAVVEDDKGTGESKPEHSGEHVDSDGSDLQAGKGEAAVQNMKAPKIPKARDITKDEKDESMSPKSSEDRKESKRRKREEKRIRKDEKRKKREEKHKRKEGKRAARAAAKLVEAKGEEKDTEWPSGKDVCEGSDGGEQSEDDDVESEQKRLRIENDLRKKALDSLRAKKAVP